MLLKTYFLNNRQCQCDANFNNACIVLWPQEIEYDRVWLVLTDLAPYMLLAIANLKPMYSNPIHVTCIAHALYRVCEALKDEYSYANEFLSCMKKAPARIQSMLKLHDFLFQLPQFSLHGVLFICLLYTSRCV